MFKYEVMQGFADVQSLNLSPPQKKRAWRRILLVITCLVWDFLVITKDVHLSGKIAHLRVQKHNLQYYIVPASVEFHRCCTQFIFWIRGSNSIHWKVERQVTFHTRKISLQNNLNSWFELLLPNTLLIQGKTKK